MMVFQDKRCLPNPLHALSVRTNYKTDILLLTLFQSLAVRRTTVITASKRMISVTTVPIQ